MDMEKIPLCEHCGQPMQLADTVSEGDKIISKRYTCACQPGVLFHHNVHAGQAGAPK
jgi:hypothetical protein